MEYLILLEMMNINFRYPSFQLNMNYYYSNCNIKINIIIIYKFSSLKLCLESVFPNTKNKCHHSSHNFLWFLIFLINLGKKTFKPIKIHYNDEFKSTDYSDSIISA